MSWLVAAIWIVCTLTFISGVFWIAAAFLELLERVEDEPPQFVDCDCGLFQLYRGEEFPGRVKVHTTSVCFPVREWIDG